MIVLKYVRLGNARFVSHIDVLRQMSRILRRAGITVKFSQGFNPHSLVYFSPPAALGIGSLAEYVAIDTDMSGEDVFARYNDSVPKDMRATEWFSMAKNPNLAGRITAADYIFPVEGGFKVYGVLSGVGEFYLALEPILKCEGGIDVGYLEVFGKGRRVFGFYFPALWRVFL